MKIKLLSLILFSSVLFSMTVHGSTTNGSLGKKVEKTSGFLLATGKVIGCLSMAVYFFDNSLETYKSTDFVSSKNKYIFTGLYGSAGICMLSWAGSSISNFLSNFKDKKEEHLSNK